jgi:hypothetical protein
MSQQHGRTSFSVRQGKELRSKTQIWEDSCNLPNDVCSHPNAIFDKASRTEEIQPSEKQTPWSRRSSLNMEIACSRSATVQTLGQHCPDTAQFRKEYRAILKSRLHSYPSRRPQLPSGHCLGNSSQMRIWIFVAY